MALSEFKSMLLPQTNCKECGFPTCLAFAMKLAAKQVDLSACPSCQRVIENPISRIFRPADPVGHAQSEWTRSEGWK